MKSEPADPRAVQLGWALFEHWYRWHPALARAHRDRHRDDEQAWLAALGTSSEARELKALLNRLERALEEVRKCLRQQSDYAAANQRFMQAFCAELEFLRRRPWGMADPVSFSLAELRHLLPVLDRLAAEVESRQPSLFDL
jgi:ElaB/YqjD/DUF883 family membrane-anchored ribosome-binding protein